MSDPIILILALTIGGFALIVLDLLFIPGGALILLGVGAIGYGIYQTHVHFGLLHSCLHTGVSLATAPFLVMWSLRRVALKKEMHSEDGYVGLDSRVSHIGKFGEVVSDLRPSGTVRVDDDGQELILDCIADGGYVEKGDKVEIIEERGPSLVCRKV